MGRDVGVLSRQLDDADLAVRSRGVAERERIQREHRPDRERSQAVDQRVVRSSEHRERDDRQRRSRDTTFTGTRNGAASKGALGALTLSSAPPFTVSGGTQIGTSALAGSVTFDSDGDLMSVSITGTLVSGNKLVVTSSTAANGAVTVNGTITTSAGAPVATFTTDASGNGILTLASGTQVPIVDWHVVW